MNDDRTTITCGVRDITNDGAGIRLQDLGVLPLNFELTFGNFHTIRRCRLIWRQGAFAGVAFMLLPPLRQQWLI
jgi:hypothetical protein